MPLVVDHRRYEDFLKKNKKEKKDRFNLSTAF